MTLDFSKQTAQKAGTIISDYTTMSHCSSIFLRSSLTNSGKSLDAALWNYGEASNCMSYVGPKLGIANVILQTISPESFSAV